MEAQVRKPRTWAQFRKTRFNKGELEEMDRLVDLVMSVMRKPKGRNHNVNKALNRMLLGMCK